MSSKRAEHPGGQGPDSLGSGDAPVGASLYRRACGRFATGVAVVTVADAAGRPHGLTVNSFTSVSLDPPLVLVSIDLRNSLLGHFRGARWFGVNVLGEAQQAVSNRFSKVPEDRFAGIGWSMSVRGVPLIEGAIAQLECAVTGAQDVGDHALLFGEVRSAECYEGAPLVYFDSGYRGLR